MPVLSVIMPAYNEAGSILEAVRDVAAHVCGTVPDSEIVVVDDGSTDGTGARLAGLLAEEPRLRVVAQPNAGHGPALLRGIREARGDVLLLLDSDRQVGLEAFRDHWPLVRDGEALAVFGVRRPRQDPRHRLVLSRAMRGFLSATFGQAPQDAGVPYKILPRRVWDEVAPLLPPDSCIPSVLAAVVLKGWHPSRVREVVVRHAARDAGVSVLNIRRLVPFCRRAVRETLRLRRTLRQEGITRVKDGSSAGVA